MNPKRRIAVLVGSDNDLVKQGYAGIAFLAKQAQAGEIELLGVETLSVHGVHDEWREYIGERHARQDVDIIIAGAGMAAHLPGMTDAVLGHALKDRQIHVVGVAFEDKADQENTLAAELSISRVPGTRMVCADADGQFTGPNGFLRACQFAVRGEFAPLNLPNPRKRESRTIFEALRMIEDASKAALENQ
jgi:phosphoribosylcarboxyaminoimidazole (NCAIR) mutase